MILTAIYCPICGIGTGDYSAEFLAALVELHRAFAHHECWQKYAKGDE